MTEPVECRFVPVCEYCAKTADENRALRAEVERQKEITQHAITTLHDRSVEMQAEVARLRKLCGEADKQIMSMVRITPEGGLVVREDELAIELGQRLRAAERGEG